MHIPKISLINLPYVKHGVKQTYMQDREPAKDIFDIVRILVTFLHHEAVRNRGNVICFTVKKLFNRTVGRLPTKFECLTISKVLKLLAQRGELSYTENSRNAKYMLKRDDKLYRLAVENYEELEKHIKEIVMSEMGIRVREEGKKKRRRV